MKHAVPDKQSIKKSEDMSQEEPKKKVNLKLIIGAVIIFAALVWLIISATRSSSQYFMTVEEIQVRSAELEGKSLRLSGAVLGDSIVYDAKKLQLSFDIVQIPGDHKVIKEMGGMAKVLADAAANPSLPKISVYYEGMRPDLLQHEAQAIVTGKLDASGVFQASELLLKCPSKYEAELPGQTQNEPGS